MENLDKIVADGEARRQREAEEGMPLGTQEVCAVQITLEIDGVKTVKIIQYLKMDNTPETIAEKIADHAYSMAETALSNKDF